VTYRLFCLNRTGNFTGVDSFDADDDEQAIAIAVAKKLPTKCELWKGNRLVAQIGAHQEVNWKSALFVFAVLAGAFFVKRWDEIITVASI
jgi:hypothetical protein